MKTTEPKKPQKFEDLTEAAKAELRTKHGDKLKTVSIPLDKDLINGPVARFAVIPPERRVINAVSKYGAENNYDKANEVMVKNCVIAGDMEYLQEVGGNDQVFYGLMKELAKFIDSGTATVGNF